MDLLRYLFWPNPGSASYTQTSIVVLLILTIGMIAGSFALSFWRKRQSNPVTRKLSAGWSRAAFWFGLFGLVMVVSRVENIQFIAMRALWLVWAAFLLLYVALQLKKWRMKHYEVLPSMVVSDPRDRYLPKKKKK
jgi:hypothetical protein